MLILFSFFTPYLDYSYSVFLFITQKYFKSNFLITILITFRNSLARHCCPLLPQISSFIQKLQWCRKEIGMILDFRVGFLFEVPKPYLEGASWVELISSSRRYHLVGPNDEDIPPSASLRTFSRKGTLHKVLRFCFNFVNSFSMIL